MIIFEVGVEVIGFFGNIGRKEGSGMILWEEGLSVY